MIGQTISHYHILERLGGGGMGVVYRAEDTRLKRSVALKFLPPDLTRDPEAKERFVHEAQAASTLQHQNLCVVHDIDETETGALFICMEYLEGETLKQKVDRGPLKIEEAIDLAGQVACGLARAHERGIIHRDIKPANIIITRDGVAKIVDFGLAKLSGASVLTQAGSTLGTTAYMSPEQAVGEEADHRSDIWSLGVVLFEMVTGRRPFHGEYTGAIVYSILNMPLEPLTAIRTGVPMELERIVQKCLSKRPQDRYQHVDELLVDLRLCTGGTLQTDSPPQPHPLPRDRAPKLLWIGATTLVAALALLAYFLLLRSEMAKSPSKIIAVLPFENLGDPEDEYFADGLTDEITSRLTSIGGLGVISRTSSNQYKNTSKAVPTIARELGADYILTGTVRWDKLEAEQRIRITPQLIKVSDDINLWTDTIDKTLNDIFAVQTEIAKKVADALDIALGEGAKQVIESTPTDNMEAYQAYLRALMYINRYESASITTAIELFNRAIQGDSSFAPAYAGLALGHLRMYWFGYDKTPLRLATAKDHIDKSLSLDPELAEGYWALGYYYYWGHLDYDQAHAALSIAEEKLPGDARLMSTRAFVWRRQGRFMEALERLRKAAILDPNFFSIPYEMGITLEALGHFDQSELEYERSISILPEQQLAYRRKSLLYLLWRADTQKSRSEIDRMPSQYRSRYYYAELDFLDRNFASALGHLAAVPTPGFVGQWSIVPVWLLRGRILQLTGEERRARNALDSSRVYLESELSRSPDDFRLHIAMGMTLAGLGRSDDAVEEADLAVRLLPSAQDVLEGTRVMVDQARVYALAGRADAALDKIEYLLSIPAPRYLTTPLLKIDPAFDPLRNHPRYTTLIRKYR